MLSILRFTGSPGQQFIYVYNFLYSITTEEFALYKYLLIIIIIIIIIMIIKNVIIKSEEQKYYTYLCAFEFHDLL